MQITNKKTSPANIGQGVIITIDPSISADYEALSWFYEGMIVISDATGDQGVVTSVDRKGSTFRVMPIQDDFNFEGSSPYKFKANDTISFYENRIGDQIWQTGWATHTTMRNGEVILQRSSNVDWTDCFYGKLGWCYQNNNNLLNDDGKLYTRFTYLNENFCPPGWRIPTSFDLQELHKVLGGLYETIGNVGWVSNMGQLKNTTGWNLPNKYAANYKNFSEKPGYTRGATGTFTLVSDQSYSLISPSLTYFYILGGSPQTALGTTGYYSFYSGTFDTYSNIIFWGSVTASSTKIKMVKNYNPFGGIS